MKWKRAVKWQIRDRGVIMVRHLSLRQEELTGRVWLDLIRLELLVTPSPEGHPRLLPLPLTLELVSAQISPELQTDTQQLREALLHIIIIIMSLSCVFYYSGLVQRIMGNAVCLHTPITSYNSVL